MQTTMMISMRSTAKDLKRLRKARLECTFKQSQPNKLIKRGELVYISRRTHTKKICLPPGKMDELNAKFAQPPLLGLALPARLLLQAQALLCQLWLQANFAKWNDESWLAQLACEQQKIRCITRPPQTDIKKENVALLYI